jgi:hypothetical protein
MIPYKSYVCGKEVESILVLYSFFSKNTNVSQNTFLGLFVPTGSYVAQVMRMTVSSMFYVLMPLP